MRGRWLIHASMSTSLEDRGKVDIHIREVGVPEREIRGPHAHGHGSERGLPLLLLAEARLEKEKDERHANKIRRRHLVPS